MEHFSTSGLSDEWGDEFQKLNEFTCTSVRLSAQTLMEEI